MPTRPATAGTDSNHINNANMDTPPDGHSPTMQLYLFEYSYGEPYFDYSGDDAGTVWHEYTHGLSNRLVVDEDGVGALNSAHAGAMGEAWSDRYAEDLLVREGLATDDPDLGGEIDLGEPSDAVRHGTRFEAIDCPVGRARPTSRRPAPAASRPGPAASRSGNSATSPRAPRSTPTARSGSRRCGTSASSSSRRSGATTAGSTPRRP